MKLIPVENDSIRVGSPLPFSIRLENGSIILTKGHLIERRAFLDSLLKQYGKLFVDLDESESHHRAYMGKLHSMVRQDKELGQIAESSLAPLEFSSLRNRDLPNTANWLDLQDQAHLVLRDSRSAEFLPRLEKLKTELYRQIKLNPDSTLFALIHLATTEVKRYSATHAMLVSAVCTLAAQDVLKWGSDQIDNLLNVALTMNIGMTELHDHLASQIEAPNAEQNRAIETHATRSHDILLSLGVSDPVWLEAVLEHRATSPGTLATRTHADRLARLIQRADMFSARLSPRASRRPESPAAAMQACYFDENRKTDEAGAALIKAVGIYSPGTFVKLASNEIAIVVRRGLNTTMPKVAVLINRQGMLTGEPILRETSQTDFRIVGSVPNREVKVNHNFDRLLLLTKQTANDRPW
jgi:HD-GYP domain-containing protein (c-di-GMP phosphodiesterase class II)